MSGEDARALPCQNARPSGYVAMSTVATESALPRHTAEPSDRVQPRRNDADHLCVRPGHRSWVIPPPIGWLAERRHNVQVEQGPLSLAVDHRGERTPSRRWSGGGTCSASVVAPLA